ncbi:MAG: bifunctional 5,10-methylenetetrahydrofolate dehydrogenase/5,10-methenyltetrahydrofolate cyclohydrolase [Elusimicrobia bacterium]|nr:bifunctional 5,10-methylenetetrahydrofolate dehydrogenase/5,10-methenyltetrahydrofolate cyclohydrolase [Elusimicrobiota bacterium]
MKAKPLSGLPLAEKLRREIKLRAQALAEKRGVPPMLAIVAVGGDAGAQVFLRKKLEACREAGFETTVESLPAGTSEAKVARLIAALGQNADVDGIVLDLPVPEPLDAGRIVEHIPAEKDVEGVTPQNAGRFYAQKSWDEIKKAAVLAPCTAYAIAHLVRETKIDPAGRRAVVLGRSSIVGRPTAHLLSCLDATVTLCHSRSQDLKDLVSSADILVCAMGRPGLVKGSWVKAGAVVVDAGVNAIDGRIVGDIDAEGAAKRAAWLTPVVGGVGPLTVTFLLYNTVLAAERRTKKTLG